MTHELRFVVIARPQPKGSTRAFIPKGWTRAIVTSDNPKNKGWQQMIAECAALELQRPGCEPFGSGPVVLTARFHLPRPKALQTKAKALRDFPHTKKPDLDKLTRAVKDALTGVVWTDDSQVVELHATKHYCAAGMFPRAEIAIQESQEDSL